MKKRTPVVIYVLGFLAAVLFTAYILLQYRDDIFALIGTGVIFLIMGYLLFDKVERAIVERAEKNNIEPQKLELLNKIYERVDADSQEMVKLQQMIIQQLKTDLDAQKNGLKAIIKYNKENARQIALNNSENVDKLTKELLETVRELGDAIQSVPIQTISAPVSRTPEREIVKSMPVEQTVSNAMEPEPVISEPEAPELVIPEPEAPELTIPEPEEPELVIPEPEESELVIPEPEESELTIPEPEVPEPEAPQSVKVPEVSGDPNKALSPDEIAALFASANSPEPEAPKAAEAEKEMPEVKAPEPVKFSKMPEIVGDPNRSLSADEIAALFASVNN